MGSTRFLLILLGCLPPAGAQTEGVSERSDLVRAFYEQSRIKPEIARIAANTDALIRQSGSSLAGADQRMSAFLDLLVAAFRQENIESLLLSQLEAKLDATKAAAVLRQLEQPLFRQFDAWEADALTVTRENAGVYTRFGESLDLTDPAVEARAERIMRLNDARRVTAFSVQTLMAATAALLEAINPYQAPENRTAEIPAMIERRSAEMIEKLDPAFLVVYLYAYRQATDEQLVGYTEFFQTDLGKWYVTTTLEAMAAAYRAAGAQAGREAATLLP